MGTPGVDDDGPGASAMLRRVVGPLARAIGRPLGLLVTLLAANAVFLPYRARYHDSILYGFQLANRASGGRHAGDLFLRFGSQDDYSLYSRLVSPLVAAIGLEPASFLAYLASVVAFYWALARLIRAIVPDRAVAVSSLIATAVALVPLGTHEVFNVNENFITPRLPAVALGMIGLERLLRGRWAQAVAALAVSMAVHPLMGFGAVLIALAWWAFRSVPPAGLTAVAVLGAAATAAVMAVPALGTRIFGEMDPAWFHEARTRSQYMVGVEWDVEDWIRVVVSLSILLAARRRLKADRRVADLLSAVAAVSATAMLGALLAGARPYALLLQGQPFRALWPLELLRLPMAFVLARSWWGGDSRGRLAAVLLVTVVTLPRTPAWSELGGFLGVSAAVGVVTRGVGARPRDPEWAWKAAAVAAFSTVVVRMVVIQASIVSMGEQLADLVDLGMLFSVMVIAIGLPVRLLLAVAVFSGLAALAGGGRRYTVAALAIFLAAQVVGLTISGRQPLGNYARHQEADLRLVARQLERLQARRDGPPTVYWPDHQAELWFDLEVNSYAGQSQSAGVAFSRGTAIEARRQADLTARFAMYEYTNQPVLYGGDWLERIAEYYGIGENPDPPTLGDLARLCDDEGLDLVVARQGYPGWYAAKNERWFIYECKRVRERAAGLLAGGGRVAAAGGGPGG